MKRGGDAETSLLLEHSCLIESTKSILSLVSDFPRPLANTGWFVIKNVFNVESNLSKLFLNFSTPNVHSGSILRNSCETCEKKTHQRI